MIVAGGQKWIFQPGTNNIFLLDDNDTPGFLSDDRYLRLPVRDTEGGLFSVFSMTEDLDGNIWVGTDKGPLVYFNPGKVFDIDLTAHRIKIPRNDGSGLADFLLELRRSHQLLLTGPIENGLVPQDREYICYQPMETRLLKPLTLEILRCFPIQLQVWLSMTVQERFGLAPHGALCQ
jgi:hypothetical protein